MCFSFVLLSTASNTGTKWEQEGEFPEELRVKTFEAGILAAAWPEEYGGTPPEGGWDMFKDLIQVLTKKALFRRRHDYGCPFQEDELIRCALGGVVASLKTFGIGLPPILNAGPQ